MRRFFVSELGKPALIAVLAVLQLLPTGCVAPAPQAQLDELSDNFTGTVNFSTERTSPFTLKGIQEHLGDFTAQGEITFHSGVEPGALIGEGVAVFTTSAGNILVGVVTWNADPEDANGQRDSEIRFSWRDSVQFNDGSAVASSGDFADPANRPPGLVVIAIIAVLIGLLLPAVQKCKTPSCL